MSQDKPVERAWEPASIQALARQLYGLVLDDARASRIAAELARLEAAAGAAGAPPPEAAPGALFRQLLLANDPAAARRA
jgi:hypothetical protein